MTQDLNNIYTYHPPKGDQPQRYTAIREKCRELAELVSELCPPSRERSLAFTKIEEASMWANASIARNETEEKEPASISCTRAELEEKRAVIVLQEAPDVPHDCATCKYEYEPQGSGPCFTCSIVARNHWEAKDRG